MDKPVTPSQLAVAVAAEQQLLVATQHNQELTVRPELVETVARVLQILGPQEHLLSTEVAVADKHVLCKALAELMVVQQVAPILRAAQASTQLMKLALVVAVDIAKVAVAPVTVVPELWLFVTTQIRHQATVLRHQLVEPQQTDNNSLVHVEHGVATPHLLIHINGSVLLVRLVVTRTFQVQLQ
jgi:hypothetical protein